MAISESKKKIVIDNYFKRECDVNTSIKEAFTKGFELGLKKAPMPSAEPKTGHWTLHNEGCFDESYVCSKCDGDSPFDYKFCPYCGCRMIEPQERSE